jgi:tetratricopeptide (TPR) repeat protein
MQEALDTTLEHSPDRAKAQFALLLAQEPAADEKTEQPSLWRPNITDTDTRLSPDEEDRITAVEQKPSRLDKSTIDSLAQVLAGQRRLDDAIGSAAVLPPAAVQLDSISHILRHASGPHRNELARVVADWSAFVGWLHTATRQDDQAIAAFQRAEELADEIGDGVIASTATSFRGYIARLQGRPRSVIRSSAAALATPGAHPTQHVYDLLQTAKAYADLGDKETARQYLGEASDLADCAGDPPSSVYWYTEPFFRLNIGLAQLAIGDYRDAADSLRSGIAEIPVDQRDAEWMRAYQEALTYADAQS